MPVTVEFPLIPLPIKEAIKAGENNTARQLLEFPLIPLPIKEAIEIDLYECLDYELFPLIPLPIKEAIQPCCGWLKKQP